MSFLMTIIVFNGNDLKGTKMREDTKKMYEACRNAKCYMNGFNPFKYENEDAAIQALRERQYNALEMLKDARPEYIKLTQAAEKAYDEAWRYVNEKFVKLFNKIETVWF